MRWLSTFDVNAPPSPTLAARLEPLFTTRYAGRDRARFYRLWNEIALSCHAEPDAITENDELVALCGPSSWGVNDRWDNLTELIMLEKRVEACRNVRTVGELLDGLM
jgi:hypothetical protein